jgi:hypothetical protein
VESKPHHEHVERESELPDQIQRGPDVDREQAVPDEGPEHRWAQNDAADDLADHLRLAQPSKQQPDQSRNEHDDRHGEECALNHSRPPAPAIIRAWQ